jgi:DNA-directed RNA polymerase subunit H (RpoH/RPB5)
MYDNIIKIINIRGYKILNEEFDGPFGHCILCDNCIVIFTRNNKININSIKTCIQFVDTIDVKNVILVYNGGITSTVSKIIDLCYRQKFELFTEQEVTIDITQHYLVPLHEKVQDIHSEFTPQQIKDLKNIPKILCTDPISKYYNFKHGDIIRITRKNGIVVYRQTI